MFRYFIRPLKRPQTRAAFIDPIQATFSNNITPQELTRLASIVNNTNNIRIKVMATQKTGYIQIGGSEVEFSLEKIPEGLRVKERRRSLPGKGEQFFDANRDNLLSVLDSLEKCENVNEMKDILRDFRFDEVGTYSNFRLRRNQNPRTSLRGSTHSCVLGNGTNPARHKQWGPDDNSASKSKKFWWVKKKEPWNAKPIYAPRGPVKE